MIALSLYIFFLIIVAIVGGMAAWSDFKGLQIPNWHSGAIICAFILCYLLMWVLGHASVFAPLTSHLLSCVIVFVITLFMFMAGGLGAADSKLGSAFALWTGLKGLMPFLFYMALIGGLLAVVALLLKRFKPVRSAHGGGWIARVQAGESKVPYGIAIVGGALVSFVKIGYLNSSVLLSFIS